MNIEIFKSRYYPEMENLFSADNCAWAYGNNEFMEKPPGDEKHIRITEKKNNH